MNPNMMNPNLMNTGGAGSFTDYTLVPADDVTVRCYRLPPKDPDDPKAKYTAEELKQLKGDDPKLIGYACSYDDLKAGQTIRATVTRKRTDLKDPDKVSYVTLYTLTGKLQKLDETSLKQFVIRVQGAAPGYGGRQVRNNQAANNDPAPDPDKLVTQIIIYSDLAAGALAGKN